MPFSKLWLTQTQFIDFDSKQTVEIYSYFHADSLIITLGQPIVGINIIIYKNIIHHPDEG